MGLCVCGGAMMMCSFGTGPCSFITTPKNKTLTSMPIANIMDNTIANIPGFIMCLSLANPTVASATAAKMGVLTPMPCVPVFPAPWVPGSPTVLIANMPALNNSSTLLCSYAGVVTISNPGQTAIMVP